MTDVGRAQAAAGIVTGASGARRFEPWPENVPEVDCAFPSSQVCLACGFRDRPKSLHVREWRCGGCGTVHDRDQVLRVAAGVWPGSSSVDRTASEHGHRPGSGLGQRARRRVRPLRADRQDPAHPASGRRARLPQADQGAGQSPGGPPLHRPEDSSTALGPALYSAIRTAWRSSSARSAWSSTPSCCSRRGTRTPR